MAETPGLIANRTQDLWRRFLRSRTPEARNRLIEAYLPLVHLVAANVSLRLPRHVDPDDLRSAGVFGLVNAIEHFDPRRGVKFETFCRKRVSGAMLDELRRQDWIPRDARDRAEQLRRAVASLRESLGREPGNREVAQALGLSMEEFHEALLDMAFASRIPVDLEGAPGRGAEERRDRIEPVDGFPEPPDVVFRRELIGLVQRYLSKRERSIVQSYYHDEQTMKRIGKGLRISESRVCQMHMRMLHRLKARLHQEVAP
ncbi:MAG: FliA/WhiG family RNA polymerase sigma factor [Planctomycetes bacterium]|nr:FliA/WhiG family RNA polymerase sigma factor [Planctomycetota bacterium]